MKNIIRYLLTTLFITMLYFFTRSLTEDPPKYFSDTFISGLFLFKGLIEKPFWFFTLFVDMSFVEEHRAVFELLMGMLLSIPLTIFAADRVSQEDKDVESKRFYILTDYEYIEKEPKENIFPVNKYDKMLDKMGLLKRTNIEKEVFYNVSIYLPEDIKPAFYHQVKKIQRVDRVFLPSIKNEAYSFISFKSLLGSIKVKKMLPSKLIKDAGGKKEFILATVIFKDKNYDTLFVDLWVKNLKIDKLVFKSNKDFDFNKNYDFKYSSTKVNTAINVNG